MKIYLVGGAVRDTLLGRTPKDRDFVVVGATPAEFLCLYPEATMIGKAFPVFQVAGPDGSACEFAFARREKKTGVGHNGFEVDYDIDVTLEEDLLRRDLTVNAMAMPVVVPEAGVLPMALGACPIIDPFNGRRDMEERVLRHVSEAFAEDSLRVFRLARFAAQLGFSVAPETTAFVESAVSSREIFALSGERVGEETRKAMRSPRPRIYFEELLRMLALGQWFPELLQLVGTPAGPPKHHAELDSFVHTMMVLDQVTNHTDDQEEGEMVRWAALTHDLGKGVTPREEWPSHRGHEHTGIPLVKRFFDRLKLPTQFKDAAVMACAEHMKTHIMLKMRPEKWVDLVRSADRTKIKAEGLAMVALADSFGREAITKDVEGPLALRVVADPIREEGGHPLPSNLKGEAIGLYIRRRKAAAAVAALALSGSKPKEGSS